MNSISKENALKYFLDHLPEDSEQAQWLVSENPPDDYLGAKEIFPKNCWFIYESGGGLIRPQTRNRRIVCICKIEGAVMFDGYF